MSTQYDVIVVGAGAAGLTAAIGLARSGFAVVVVEAALFPGAENWSGCVFFCENLAHQDILGPDGVEALAWERRLVERGCFATDGHGLLGLNYRDQQAFENCYTVLRPVFDRHLSQVARQHGVEFLTSTTAESLIRDQKRVIGICTNRGALYADLVFLAEGDASHLVTREGYERFAEPKRSPKFLLGLKQVLELPAPELEERFGLNPEQGAAYEILIRDGLLKGQTVHLNIRGFLYTNRESLSLGLLLPLDSLHEHFEGDPNLLMEWMQSLPSLQPWLCGSKQAAFGAKVIRAGGAREIPQLIDHGLAIGGAASAVGIDFPYLNYTGPATAMGLLITRAARRISQEGGHFSKENLRRYYLRPLENSHYWKDVQFLHRWPAYVRRTKAFFAVDMDLILQTAYVWTRSNQGILRRWKNWLQVLIRFAASPEWTVFRADLIQLRQSLRLPDVIPHPGAWRLLLDGSLNAVRDLCRSPRVNLPQSGEIYLHYTLGGSGKAGGLAPGSTRRWFNRFVPVLASAAKLLYANDDIPLATKLRRALQLLARQVNLLDLVALGFVGALTGISSLIVSRWKRNLRGFPRAPQAPAAVPEEQRALEQGTTSYLSAARQTRDMTPHLLHNIAKWHTRLATLQFTSSDHSHVHLLWPHSLEERRLITQQGLWHICPANVFRANVNPPDPPQLNVEYANCIKCEACWRLSDLVDWGRNGQHRFVYTVSSTAPDSLSSENDDSTTTPSSRFPSTDYWSNRIAKHMKRERSPQADALPEDIALEITSLLLKLERKLFEYDTALGKPPSVIDRNRSEFLDMLSRYAQQLLLEIETLLQSLKQPPTATPLLQLLRELVRTAHSKAEHRSKMAWNHRFQWAAADGRQLRFHHLPGIRKLLGQLSPAAPRSLTDRQNESWLLAEQAAEALSGVPEEWSPSLDIHFPRSAESPLETHQPLSKAQDGFLRNLVAHIPLIDPTNLRASLHPPMRKFLLRQLGSRSPSLAYCVASHLWARDLVTLLDNEQALSAYWTAWTTASEWAAFAIPDSRHNTDAHHTRVGAPIPVAVAGRLVLLLANRLIVMPPPNPTSAQTPATEQPSLLTPAGAAISMVQLPPSFQPECEVPVTPETAQNIWVILSSTDLICIALGVTDVLLRRALTFADTRPGTPGSSNDDQDLDGIGRLAFNKKMLAQLAAHRYLIETLCYNLSPEDLQPDTARKTTLLKALVAELLTTARGGITYNAAQVFGAAGCSEDAFLVRLFQEAADWKYLGPEHLKSFVRRGETLKEKRAEYSVHALEVAKSRDELAQRKALGSEFEELLAHQSRMNQLNNDWVSSFASRESNTSASSAKELGMQAEWAQLSELLGRQDAFLLAEAAALLRTHARLEQGYDSELESALLRVCLEDGARRLGEFEKAYQRYVQSAPIEEAFPMVDPSSGPPVTTYEELLNSANPYTSGDFLTMPVDTSAPRFVPEMMETDPEFAGEDQGSRVDVEHGYQVPRAASTDDRHGEGKQQPKAHHPEFCQQRRWLRPPIREDLGGGLLAELLLHIANMHHMADAALSPLMPANTQISSPGSIRWRLRQIEELTFISEALAFDVVGRVDCNPAAALALEAAIAKMLVTELHLNVMQTAEQIHSLSSQAPSHLFEQHKRDALNLTLGAGANERWRSFLLRELTFEAPQRWGQPGGPASGFLGREGIELEHLKASLRELLQAALSALGQEMWTDPKLQASCFPLADATVWVAAADSTFARLTWLIRREMDREHFQARETVRLAQRAMLRSTLEIRDRIKRFADELVHLRRGFYPSEVRAASLLFR